MAQPSKSYDQAVEMMLGWYHHMRVDHLLEDELLFELEMRTIVIHDDPTCCRKRRSLKQRMRDEKEENIILHAKLNAEKVEELGLCDQKYQEMCDVLRCGESSSKEKCKTRLLHLSHRLFQMVENCRENNSLAEQLRILLVKCVVLLRDFFYTQPSAREKNNEEDLPIEGLFVEPSAPPQNDNVQTDDGDSDREVLNNASFNREILALQARIRRLEEVLALYESEREISAQAVSVGDNVRSNCPSVRARSVENPTITTNSGRSNPTKGFNPATAIPPNTCEPTLTNAFQPTSSVPNYFNNPPQAPQVCPAYAPNNPPQMGNNYSCSNAASCPIYNNANPILNLNAAQNSLNPGRASHRTLPVSRWTLTKYDGEDHGLKLNEFLEVVQALSLAEHVSEEELFESAVHLFTGHALKWYMTMRTMNRLLNWPHLVLELRRTFMHPDLDALIKMKIYQRRQLRNEPFNEFYYEMERLFRTMSNQIPDYEKMQILLQNMRIDYKRQLNFLPLTDLATLVAAGQKVDALNFSAYNKVFERDKHTNAVTAKDPKSKPNKVDQQHNKTPALATQSNHRDRNRNTSNYNQNSTLSS